MNSTINKILHMFYRIVFFLRYKRYKKISKKAAKIGGYDDCFWKTNLSIFWNHVMKNFQVKHGQRDSMILPKNLKALGNY